MEERKETKRKKKERIGRNDVKKYESKKKKNQKKGEMKIEQKARRTKKDPKIMKRNTGCKTRQREEKQEKKEAECVLIREHPF